MADFSTDTRTMQHVFKDKTNRPVSATIWWNVRRIRAAQNRFSDRLQSITLVP